MDLLVGFHLHFARNGMLKHPIPYIGMDAQANLTVGSGEKRLIVKDCHKAQGLVPCDTPRSRGHNAPMVGHTMATTHLYLSWTHDASAE